MKTWGREEGEGEEGVKESEEGVVWGGGGREVGRGLWRSRKRKGKKGYLRVPGSSCCWSSFAIQMSPGAATFGTAVGEQSRQAAADCGHC